jgi:hypothetical protein
MVSRAVFVRGEVTGEGPLLLMYVGLEDRVVGGVFSGESVMLEASLGFGLGGAEIAGLELGLVGNRLGLFRGRR